MCPLYVFDKMPKWHFVVVLNSDEYQTLGITMIMYVYHVVIIGCVLYTLCPLNVCSCIGHASHMHTRCTLLHTLLHLTCFCIHFCWLSLLDLLAHITCSCVYVMPRSISCSIILSMSCSLRFVAFF